MQTDDKLLAIADRPLESDLPPDPPPDPPQENEEAKDDPKEPDGVGGEMQQWA